MLVVGALAAGCGAVLPAPTTESGIRPVDPGVRPVVLTTFSVLADLIGNVAGDKAEVRSILPVGAEIHGYEPTSRDIARAVDADLIFDNGLGLERWFAQFVENLDVAHVVMSTGVTPQAIEGDPSLPRGGFSAGHEAGEANPHAWMSPRNARQYIVNIVDALTRLDPSNAATYRANADRYTTRLRAAETDLLAGVAALAPNQRALVTCEGAFSYLAADAGLTERYLWPVNADEQGTQEQVTRTIEFVKERDVPTVFCESTVSDKSMRSVADATGARLAGPLYVDSLSGPDGPVPTYLDLVRYDISTIVSALSDEDQ